ncbi:MAG: hypothetical protein KC656_13210 [Myxococcales bacterium]|nr:hypothetical protein [Myxococcales bacterium]MCB9668032.1 hypothetical protein [Alphaproteobacteria bacterium]MCB9693466.1 hypothetical protein [Alphaproteobacteria bacterium]
MSVLAFPTLWVLALVEATAVMFGLLYVSRRHPRAGLLLSAAGALSLSVTVLQPLLELVGFVSISGRSSPGWPVVVLLATWWTGPLARAFNLLLILVAVGMLARELPDRRDPDGRS